MNWLRSLTCSRAVQQALHITQHPCRTRTHQPCRQAHSCISQSAHPPRVLSLQKRHAGVLSRRCWQTRPIHTWQVLSHRACCGTNYAWTHPLIRQPRRLESGSGNSEPRHQPQHAAIHSSQQPQLLPVSTAHSHMCHYPPPSLQPRRRRVTAHLSQQASSSLLGALPLVTALPPRALSPPQKLCLTYQQSHCEWLRRILTARW